MRILINESLPRQLVTLLIGHDARMVQADGWSSVKNGELLRHAAAAGFEVFVTPDRKLEYQQQMPRVDVAVVVLRARTNCLEDIAPLVPALLDVLPEVRVGTVSHVGVSRCLLQSGGSVDSCARVLSNHPLQKLERYADAHAP